MNLVVRSEVADVKLVVGLLVSVSGVIMAAGSVAVYVTKLVVGL